MMAPKPFEGRSLTTSAFWDCFSRLSDANKSRARDAHRPRLANPKLPGLRF